VAGAETCAELFTCVSRAVLSVAGLEQALERAREIESQIAKKVADLQKTRNRLGVARARIIAQSKNEEASREAKASGGASTAGSVGAIGGGAPGGAVGATTMGLG
jgi:hypothetical protein